MTLPPADPTTLLETAAELNALPSVGETLPLLVDRMRELVGADTTSVISWDTSLQVGRVCAASGFASERVGELTRFGSSLPRLALECGSPQSGELGSTGYKGEIETMMSRLRRAVSVPVVGGDHPLTLQAAWLGDVGDETLAAAALTLAQLAAVTGLGRLRQGEARQESERARLDAVLDRAGDGIVVERDGTWTANRAAQRMLALPDELIHGVEELNVRHLDGTVVRKGDGLPERFRVRVTTLAGEERVLDGSATIAAGGVIVFRDVTEEHRRATTTAEYLRSLLDTIPTAICVVEQDTRRVLSTNRAFLQLLDRSEDDVVGALPPFAWWADGEEALYGDGGDEYARVFVRPDGTSVPVEVQLHDLRDADGSVYAQLGVITDLTERHRFRQQLTQSGKLAAIGELAAGVAHEVNNPLFAILGLVEFLLNDAEPGTKSYDRLELIQSTALEIKEIVRSLLDFARESTDDTAVVPLDEVIAETVTLVRRTTAGHGVEIEEQLQGGPFLVDGSPNQLKQVFLNLLANARQAMPDGGTVRITVSATADEVIAVVADTGVGIEPGTLGRIFEPFFTTKRGLGGTGLGLSVSLGIAESHGGSLTAASTPGAGAAFTLRLPRHVVR
jgi:PAS domain S-box-containing protein